MKDVFRTYMGALAEALRQDLPNVSDTRAEFAVDGIPFVFTADEEGPSIFSCAVVGALPGEEAARSRVFAELLHAQFCFSEDGLVVAMNNGQCRQLMKEAQLLAQRTDPRSSRGEEMKRLSRNVTDLEQNGAPANEIAAARNLRDELNAELDAKEREQTENLSDQDIVDLVENVIRSSPKDFPLLTKYYLNAE